VNEHNLQQCNNIPTRGNNILDLVFTTNNGISDHQAVIVSIKTKVKTAKKKPRKIFMYSKGNMPKIKERLKDKLPNYIIGNREKGIDNCWESFKDILISLMTQNIPQKNCTSRWNIPWINKRIRRSMRTKQRQYNKAKTSDKPEDWAKFKATRKAIKKTSNVNTKNT